MAIEKTPLGLVHELILAGTETNDVLAAIKKAFPKTKETITGRTVSFHRTLLRKLGHTVPRAGRSDKGAPRTVGKPKPKAKIRKAKAAAAKRKAAPKKPAAKRPAAKKPAAKKAAPAKRPAAKKPAAKRKAAPAKRPAAKKPAAKKKPATKKTAARSKRGAKARTSR